MPISSRTRDLLLLAAVCFLCFFWRLGSVGLFDFNEGFYTQVAREMYLRGDYVTPRVNGILFFDKPPLAIWLSALSFHLFGVSEFAARLPVALAATALVFCTYGFGARFFGRTAGMFAGLMVALNPLFYGTARQMTMDIHQSLWFSIALFAFYTAWQGNRASEDSLTPPASRFTIIYYHLFWAACGLAVLAKSVPGLFPLAVAFVFVAITERFRVQEIMARIWEARVLTGLPLMLAVIVPWFYLAWKANGRVFYEEFWLLHHVQLASGGDFSHSQPFWYYLPALLAGFFPWSLFLPWALNRNAKLETRKSHLFALVWAGVVFVVFSLMKSKLISYLLPMYPAAALLVGDWIARAIADWKGREARGLRIGTAIGSIVSVIALGAGIAAANYILTSPNAARQRQDVPAGLLEFGVHALIVTAVGITLAALLFWRGRQKAGLTALFSAVCLFIALANVEGLSAIESKMNAPLQSLARVAGDKLAAGDPLAIHIGQPRRPSVLFYLPSSAFLGKPLDKVGPSGIVFERGEPEPTEEFLAANPGAYVLTDEKRADVLKVNHPKLSVIEKRDRWLLLRSAATPPTPVATLNRNPHVR